MTMSDCNRFGERYIVNGVYVGKWSSQEAFDHVWNKLTEQGRPSVERRDVGIGDEDFGWRCVYRKIEPDGTVLKCAAGWLLNDEDYSPTLEGSIAFNNRRFGMNDSTLLIAMQGAHDGAFREAGENGEAWLPVFHKRMRDIAEKFGLTVPEATPTAPALPLSKAV